jgi:hypothetical protein
VQPDQNQIISCAICRHFRFCILDSNRQRAKPWTIAKVASEARFLEENCRPVALLYSILKTGSRTAVESGVTGPAVARRKPRPARLCRSSKATAASISDHLAKLPQRSDLAFLLLGNERPMVAGPTAVTEKALVSTFRIINPMRELNDEVQARVYLARRIHADPESARQNPDQGF